MRPITTWRPARFLTTLTTLVALAPALGGGPAHAASTDQWAVEPAGPDGPGRRPHFAYVLAPGESVRDVVAVSNLTEQPIKFAVYAKDAYNTSGDAAFALLADDEESSGVGAWITLAATEYTVPARSRVEIPFDVEVPADAEPGDHAGGIIAANVEPLRVTGDRGVDVALFNRVATRVYVRVDGPTTTRLRIDHLEVSQSTPVVPWVTGRGDASITYRVTNTGNVRVRPRATVEVEGLFGRTVRRFPTIDLPELLPGSSVTVGNRWSGLPPLDRLEAVLTVETRDGQRVTRSGSVLVVPWTLLTVVAVVAAAIVGRWWWRRRAAGRAAERR